jgi:hypothetical protein
MSVTDFMILCDYNAYDDKAITTTTANGQTTTFTLPLDGELVKIDRPERGCVGTFVFVKGTLESITR